MWVSSCPHVYHSVQVDINSTAKWPFPLSWEGPRAMELSTRLSRGKQALLATCEIQQPVEIERRSVGSESTNYHNGPPHHEAILSTDRSLSQFLFVSLPRHPPPSSPSGFFYFIFYKLCAWEVVRHSIQRVWMCARVSWRGKNDWMIDLLIDSFSLVHPRGKMETVDQWRNPTIRAIHDDRRTWRGRDYHVRRSKFKANYVTEQRDTTTSKSWSNSVQRFFI